jgi:hypothetical protein
LNKTSFLFTVFIWCASLCNTAQAQDTYINAAETLAFGTFSATGTKRFTRGATRSAPPADTIEDYRFEDFTTRIPMVLGTQFGIEYQVNTKPKNRPISLTKIIRFPEPGLQQPRGKTYYESKETQRLKVGEPHLHGYGFDEEWELVPGEWVFEVWHNKAKLVSKTFTVYDPAEAESSD